MKPRLSKSLREKNGIVLHLGCGISKESVAVGMDKRALPGVDIVWDMEKIPWPLEDESCVSIIARHILEHLNPQLTFDIFDEMWRVLKVGGQLAVLVPWGGSTFYLQDPTHRTPYIDRTFWYLDPEHFSKLWDTYEPKPWEIMKGFPTYQVNGNMECVLRKRELNTAKPSGTK